MEHIFACCQPLSTRVAVARSTPDHETTASPASAASSTPHSFFSLLSPSQPPTPSPQAACDADARAVKVAEDPVSRPPPAKAFGYQTQAAEARRLASEAQERCSELEKLAAAAELAAGAHLEDTCQEASAETQARAEEASGAIIVSMPHPLRRLAPNAGSFRRRGSEPCTLGASSTASRLHQSSPDVLRAAAGGALDASSPLSLSPDRRDRTPATPPGILERPGSARKNYRGLTAATCTEGYWEQWRAGRPHQ